MKACPFRLSWTLVLAGCLVRLGAGQEFRVETDVFLDNQQEAAFQNLTLFSQGLVYDLQLQPASRQVSILDRDRGVLVLLDGERKCKTVVTTQQLLQFTAELKGLLSQDKTGAADPALFLPQFTDSFDPERGELKLMSSRVLYDAQIEVPPDRQAVVQYQQFADWYARLNAMHFSYPPFARLDLNQRIALRGGIPRRVVRTILPADSTQPPQVLRTQHLVDWQLSTADRKRIEVATEQRIRYEQVHLNEFWQVAQLASQLPAEKP